MPNLQDAFRRHAETYLAAIQKLAKEFQANGAQAANCIEELDEFWPQIETAQRWAEEHYSNDEAAALITEQYAALCAENGDQILELHRSAALRVKWLRAAVAAADQYRRMEQHARLSYNLGTILVSMGETREAEEHLVRAKTAFRHFGWSADETAALNSLGLLASQEENYGLAVQRHEAAAAIAKNAGLAREFAVSVHFLAKPLLALGAKSKAFARMEESVIAFEDIDDYAATADASADLGWMYYRENELEEAMVYCEKALHTVERRKLPTDGKLLHHRLLALMFELKHDKLDEVLECTLAVARESRNRMLEGCLLQLKSLIAVTQNNRSQAREFCSESIIAFEAVGFYAGIESGKKLLIRLN